MPTATKTKKTTAKPAAKPVKTAKIVKKADSGFTGTRAPTFSLSATKIGKVSAASLKGEAYVLYFYPKDDTSGCTAEACAFRDALPNFAKLGIKVFGVSKDSLDSHEKFAKKYNLNFPLISDNLGTLCEKYAVWKQKSMYGRHYMGIERSTFLIDGKGIIRAEWRKVNVPGHADEVKKAIADL